MIIIRGTIINGPPRGTEFSNGGPIKNSPGRPVKMVLGTNFNGIIGPRGTSFGGTKFTVTGLQATAQTSSWYFSTKYHNTSCGFSADLYYSYNKF